MTDKTYYRHLSVGRLEMLHRGLSTLEGTHFHPPTNVVETADSVVIIVEVAGLQEGDYEISLSDSDRLLTVAGRRQSPSVEANRVVYHRLEIPFGGFVVEVHLPWALERAENATAVYDDGFLMITLPKAKPRQVTVRYVEA